MNLYEIVPWFAAEIFFIVAVIVLVSQRKFSANTWVIPAAFLVIFFA
ncbi:MAG: hypothetical protein AAF387_14910 [Pseudomonadota bacterium]